MVSLPTPDAPVMTKRTPALSPAFIGGWLPDTLLVALHSVRAQRSAPLIGETLSWAAAGAGSDPRVLALSPGKVRHGPQVHLRHGWGRLQSRERDNNLQHRGALPRTRLQRHRGE